MDVTRCGGRGGRVDGRAFDRAIRLAGNIPIGCTAGAAAAGLAVLRAAAADFALLVAAGAGADFARAGFVAFAAFAAGLFVADFFVANFLATDFLAIDFLAADFFTFAAGFFPDDFFDLAADRAFARVFEAALAFARTFGFAAFRRAFDFGLADALPAPRRALADRPAADFFPARPADFFALPAPDLRLIAISLYLPSDPRGGGIMHLRQGGAPPR